LFQLVLRGCRQIRDEEPGSAMHRLVGGLEATVIFEDPNQCRSTFLSLVELPECGGD
jgi:hypothetical protein